MANAVTAGPNDAVVDLKDGRSLSDLHRFEIFQDAVNAANVYWENQSGDGMHIDIDRIVKKVSKTDVKKLLGG